MMEEVYLGESLSTLTLLSNKITDEATVVDIWHGGSLLSCIRISELEVDKVPILIRRQVKVDSISFKPDVVFIGSEESYNNRVSTGIEIQRNWLQELSQGGLIPKNFFCSLYRHLRSLVKARRIYDVISSVELKEKKLKLLRYGVLHYDTLVNTLPLPYFISKVGIPPNIKNDIISKLDYVGLLINIALTRCTVDKYTILYIGKKNFTPHTVVLIPLEDFREGFTNYAIVYSIASIRRPYISFRGEYISKLLLDINKLRVFNVEFLSYRVIHERYGLLGSTSDELESYLGSLRDADIVLKGRLGTWKELSIECLLSSNCII